MADSLSKGAGLFRGGGWGGRPNSAEGAPTNRSADAADETSPQGTARPLGIADAAPARQNMAEAAAGDIPSRVPPRPSTDPGRRKVLVSVPLGSRLGAWHCADSPGVPGIASPAGLAVTAKPARLLRIKWPVRFRVPRFPPLLGASSVGAQRGTRINVKIGPRKVKIHGLWVPIGVCWF